MKNYWNILRPKHLSLTLIGLASLSTITRLNGEEVLVSKVPATGSYGANGTLEVLQSGATINTVNLTNPANTKSLPLVSGASSIKLAWSAQRNESGQMIRKGIITLRSGTGKLIQKKAGYRALKDFASELKFGIRNKTVGSVIALPASSLGLDTSISARITMLDLREEAEDTRDVYCVVTKSYEWGDLVCTERFDGKREVTTKRDTYDVDLVFRFQKAGTEESVEEESIARIPYAYTTNVVYREVGLCEQTDSTPFDVDCNPE